MRLRKLDTNSDYVLGTGNDWLVNSPEAVAQLVETTLKLRMGEWFLDLLAGLDYGAILGKFNSNHDVLIKEVILGVQGVAGLTSYSSSFDSANRALTVRATISTAYGAATVATTL